MSKLEVNVSNNKKINRKCKYFHHDPYMTPNNFDLYFDYNSIPMNIDVGATYDLNKRLQRVMPLSKKIHLNLENRESSQSNGFNINTRIRLSFKKGIPKKIFSYVGLNSVTDTDKFIAQTGATITKQADGTLFSATTSSNGWIWANLTGTTESTTVGDYTGDFIIEYDVVSSSHQNNGIIIYENYSQTNTNDSFQLFTPNSTGHIKVTKYGEVFKLYVNGVLKQSVIKFLTEPLRIGFRVQGNNNLKIHNFMIYDASNYEKDNYEDVNVYWDNIK